MSDCCFQLYHDSTSSYKYFAHILDETTLIFINDRNEWITRTSVYNNTFYSIIRKTLSGPKIFLIYSLFCSAIDTSFLQYLNKYIIIMGHGNMHSVIGRKDVIPVCV